MSRYAAGPNSTAQHRDRVVRPAIFYTAITGALLTVVLIALYHILIGELGYLVMFCVFGGVGLLTGFQMQQYLRDLKADPIVLEGEVLKKWHKGNFLFFLMPSFYIYVADKSRAGLEALDEEPWGKIFTISRVEYARLLETDLLRITCYPHSLTVEQLELYDEVRKVYAPADDGALT